MADKNSLIDSAQRFLQKGQLDKAIREYYRALEQDPRDVRVRHKLGELLGRQGTRGEALKELGTVAEAYAKDGFYTKAVAVYKQMIKLKPDLYEVHLKLGGLYQQLSLLSEAMEHYRLVAEYYELNGTSKDCLEVFKKIVDLSPDDTHSKLKLAEYYVREEKTDDAVALYQAVATQFREKNRLDDLIRVYERLVQLTPQSLDNLKTLSKLYVEAQEPKRALAKLQVCFKADPGDAEILQMLGETFMALDQLPKAKSVYKELARIYDYRGFPEKRREIFERIRRIDPSDPEALQALGLDAKPAAPAPAEPRTAPNARAGAGAVAPPPPVVSVPVAPPPPAKAVVAPPPVMTAPPPPPPAAAAAKEASAAPASEGGTGTHRAPSRTPAAPAAPASTPPAPVAVAAAPAGSARYREIPAAVAKLMTEAEVYLKYNLVDKATSHLQLILERSPDCYPALEKRRDLLVSQGRSADAAQVCQQMSMIAAAAGDLLQARLDLERAIELQPDNPILQHALASLSRIAPPAAAPAQAAPPFFQASSSAQVVLIDDEEVVEDEDEQLQSISVGLDDEHVQSLSITDEEEHSKAREEHRSAIQAGIDDSELVDDDAAQSIYLTLSDDAFSNELEGVLSALTELGGPGIGSRGAPVAEAAADAPTVATATLASASADAGHTGSASRGKGAAKAKAAEEHAHAAAEAARPAEPAAAAIDAAGGKSAATATPAVTPAATAGNGAAASVDKPAASRSIATEEPAARALNGATAPVSDGFDEFELVEDGDGMDLLRELEVELAAEGGPKRGAEPVDRAANPVELARAYYEMRLYDEALRQLDEVRQQSPLMMEAQLLFGRCHYQKNELGDAVRWFQTVLNRNDLTTAQELEVLFDLGLAYEAQSEYHLALDLYEEISGIDDSFREQDVQARIQEVTARAAAEPGGKLRSAR